MKACHLSFMARTCYGHAGFSQLQLLHPQCVHAVSASSAPSIVLFQLHFFNPNIPSPPFSVSPKRSWYGGLVHLVAGSHTTGSELSLLNIYPKSHYRKIKFLPFCYLKCNLREGQTGVVCIFTRYHIHSCNPIRVAPRLLATIDEKRLGDKPVVHFQEFLHSWIYYQNQILMTCSNLSDSYSYVFKGHHYPLHQCLFFPHRNTKNFVLLLLQIYFFSLPDLLKQESPTSCIHSPKHCHASIDLSSLLQLMSLNRVQMARSFIFTCRIRPYRTTQSPSLKVCS